MDNQLNISDMKTVAQAAVILGCSTRTVLRHIKDNKIEAFFINERYYFTDEALQNFILSKRIKKKEK